MTTTTDKPYTIATTDGQYVYLSDGRPRIPVQHPFATVAALCEACRMAGIKQLWVYSYKAPISISGDKSFGWDMQPNELAPWIHAIQKGTHDKNDEIDIVFPEMEKRNPWAAAADAQELLNALQRYRLVVGVPFHRSGMSTAAALMRRLHESRRAAQLAVVDMPPLLTMGANESPLTWLRALTEREKRMGWIHAYDKNAAFLGACHSLDLGTSTLDHLQEQRVTADAFKLPGYFLADIDEGERIPSFMRRGSGPQWVTTPTLRYAMERGAEVHVWEAWVWRVHGRPMQSWYERLRNARVALLDERQPGARVARLGVKATYAGFTGGYLGSDGKAQNWDRTQDPLYRPDIRHQIIAAARVALVRKVDRCLAEDGMIPAAIGGVDTVYYISDDPDPRTAKPGPIVLGDENLAHFKVKGSVPLAEVAHLFDASQDKPQARLNALQDALRPMTEMVGV